MTTDPLTLDFFAIDPGDVHVGLAEFRGGVCVAASETQPQAIEDRVFATAMWQSVADGAGRILAERQTPDGGVAHPRLLVVERFALRGDLMAQQQGSEFLTSQLIGSLRFICRTSGMPLVIQTPQQASLIRKRHPWSSWPVRRWTSYGHGGHAKMAEQHGLFYIQERLRAQDPARMNQWLNTLA